MNQVEFGGFRRINRKKAKNLYKSGSTIYLCSSNMSPESIWQPAIGISKPADDTNVDSLFEAIVNEYTYFNCNKETGRQVFFYEKFA